MSHVFVVDTNKQPLEVEHINPRSRSHDNRVCNLTLACHPCNDAKGNQDIREFLAKKPDLLARLLAQAKAPLKDAAAVNTTQCVSAGENPSRFKAF